MKTMLFFSVLLTVVGIIYALPRRTNQEGTIAQKDLDRFGPDENED